MLKVYSPSAGTVTSKRESRRRVPPPSSLEIKAPAAPRRLTTGSKGEPKACAYAWPVSTWPFFKVRR